MAAVPASWAVAVRDHMIELGFARTLNDPIVWVDVTSSAGPITITPRKPKN